MSAVHAWLEKWFWRFYALGLRRQPENPKAAFDGACGEFAVWVLLPLVGVAFAILVPSGFGAVFGLRAFPWVLFGVGVLVAMFGFRWDLKRRLSQPGSEDDMNAVALTSRVWLFRGMSAGIFFTGVLLGAYLRGDFSP